MMGSDALFSICVIYNLIATTPALDHDPLRGPQTSWVVEGHEAIRRWEQELGLDSRTIGRYFRYGFPGPKYV